MSFQKKLKLAHRIAVNRIIWAHMINQNNSKLKYLSNRTREKAAETIKVWIKLATKG